MRKRRERSPQEVEEDAHWFEETRAVIETGVSPAIDPRAVKMFRFLFNGGSDGLVSREGFLVRFTGNPGPHSYVMSLAPIVVGQLLFWAGAGPRCSELRGVPLATKGLRLLGPPGGSINEAQLLWFADGGEVIRFALRVSSEQLRTAAWPPIITLPSRVPVYLDLNPPRPCPRCAVPLSRVRDLGDAMICGTCGRSFRSWDPDSK